MLEWLEPGDESRGELERGLAELAEPLRVAVIGPTGAGRSSLVNALLGSHVARGGDPALAAADISFAYGTPERVEVHLAGDDPPTGSGDTIRHGLLPDGTIPEDIIPPGGEIAAVRVWLPLQTLRTLTLIDSRATPEPAAQATARPPPRPASPRARRTPSCSPGPTTRPPTAPAMRASLQASLAGPHARRR